MVLRSRRLLLNQVGLLCLYPTTPHLHTLTRCGFSLNSAVFTRRYLRHPYWFLFLPLRRCFNSGRSPSQRGVMPKHQEVPFGDLRIKDSLRLPGAYRSLARPSSVLEPSHPPAGILAISHVSLDSVSVWIVLIHGFLAQRGLNPSRSKTKLARCI